MQRVTITRAGQMSVPASIRNRWRTRTVAVDDRGDYFVVRPVPPDPVKELRGAFAGRGPSSDEARRLAREEERMHEEKRARSARSKE